VLTVISFVLAFLIGLIIAACRVSPVPPLQRFAATYTQLARNTPLTALMLLGAFGLPDIGLTIPLLPTAVVALSLYTGAFLAESIRSGINAVSQGQAEAARSLGLTFAQVLTLVIMPQAIRTVIPPIGNLFIALTKNSSVAYVISVTELTGTARILGNQTAQTLQAFAAAALGYLLLLIPAGLAFGALERRVAIKR
jgi:glutamate transport system permease protein